jgi:hypothetical protein
MALAVEKVGAVLAEHLPQDARRSQRTSGQADRDM